MEIMNRLIKKVLRETLNEYFYDYDGNFEDDNTACSPQDALEDQYYDDMESEENQINDSMEDMDYPSQEEDNAYYGGLTDQGYDDIPEPQGHPSDEYNNYNQYLMANGENPTEFKNGFRRPHKVNLNGGLNESKIKKIVRNNILQILKESYK